MAPSPAADIAPRTAHRAGRRRTWFRYFLADGISRLAASLAAAFSARWVMACFRPNELFIATSADIGRSARPI